MASRSSNRAITRRAQVGMGQNALATMSPGAPPAAPQKAKAQVYDAVKGPKVPTPAKGLFRKSHRPGFDRTE
jgi:hypothetical protein